MKYNKKKIIGGLTFTFKKIKMQIKLWPIFGLNSYQTLFTAQNNGKVESFQYESFQFSLTVCGFNLEQIHYLISIFTIFTFFGNCAKKDILYSDRILDLVSGGP